jgi:site-specific recombinase XerD
MDMYTLSTGIEEFVNTKRVKRSRTFHDYVYRMSIIHKAAQICGLADRDIREINSKNLFDLVIVIDSKEHFPGLCENTVASIVKRLKTFFRWLLENGVISSNPAEKVDYRRTEPRGTLPFEEEEFSALFALSPQTDSQKRDCVVFHLALDTGLRLEEICRLCIRDINGTQITLCGKGGTHRTVSFGEKSRCLLSDYLDQFRRNALRDAPLFVTAEGQRLTNTTLAHRLSLWAAKAGVRGAAFHRFRVSYAVQFILNGGDPLELQMLLGHKDLTMTRYYCQLAYRRKACTNNSRRSIVDALCVANRPQEAQPQPGFVESAGSGEAIANTPEMMFQMFQTWLALVSRMQTNQGEKQTENIPPLPSLAWMQLTDQFRQTPWHSKK